jgi:hypothetical protein
LIAEPISAAAAVTVVMLCEALSASPATTVAWAAESPARSAMWLLLVASCPAAAPSVPAEETIVDTVRRSAEFAETSAAAI